MRSQWLQRQNTESLTLVFGGWGLGATPFRPLTGSEDVLFVDDYQTLDLDPKITAPYRKTALLAFSFGVASALHWLATTQWRPDRLIAVNGTAYPADPDKGIAPDVAQATADRLTEARFASFVRRCGGPALDLCPDIPTRRAELHAIIARGPAPERPFDVIWISQNDKIIPPAAQRTAWQSQIGVIRELAAPHQPFAHGQRWEDWGV